MWISHPLCITKTWFQHTCKSRECYFVYCICESNSNTLCLKIKSKSLNKKKRSFNLISLLYYSLHWLCEVFMRIIHPIYLDILPSFLPPIKLLSIIFSLFFSVIVGIFYGFMGIIVFDIHNLGM